MTSEFDKSYFPETRLIALIMLPSFKSLPAESHISFSSITAEIGVALLRVNQLRASLTRKSARSRAILPGSVPGWEGERRCPERTSARFGKLEKNVAHFWKRCLNARQEAQAAELLHQTPEAIPVETCLSHFWW